MGGNMSIHSILYVITTVLFVLAGFGVPAKVRWEWLAFAALTLSLLI